MALLVALSWRPPVILAAGAFLLSLVPLLQVLHGL
jgi:hypothetical protein